MFACFFPRPRLFLLSTVVWITLAVAFWVCVAQHWAGPPAPASAASQGLGGAAVSALWTRQAFGFYVYYWIAAALFWLAWQFYSPHPWARWSILGSALIGFQAYLNAKLGVLVNAWLGPFYNMVQNALAHTGHASPADFYAQLLKLVEISAVMVLNTTIWNFFSSHFVFRWRTALNSYYTAHWAQLRTIEGASQRVQEDAMRFSEIMEGLCVNFIAYVAILIAFLPVLVQLSTKIAGLPLLGRLPYGLVVAALLWSLGATGIVALTGVRLPGLEIRNQKVEAAYRKELVYGEDDAERARLSDLTKLFADVRRNYFSVYLNFLYFNAARFSCLYLDSAVALFLLIPTILAGTITFGLFTQIISAFASVRSAFEYLASSWDKVIDLLSVYGRLRSFESRIAPVRHGAGEPIALGVR